MEHGQKTLEAHLIILKLLSPGLMLQVSTPLTENFSTIYHYHYKPLMYVY